MKTERRLATAASIVALIGALYTVYSALTYKPVSLFRAEISACNPEASEWLDLVEFLHGNAGEVVLLYLRVTHLRGDCETDFIYRDEGTGNDSQVAYYSLSSSVAEGSDAISSPELASMLLWAENGVSISFEEEDFSWNAQTFILVSDEGMYDVFSGPFQNQFGMGDAAMWFTLSPPIISDETARRIRCADQEWGYFLNVLLCPII